jgi:chromosome partitioning protein
MKVVAVLSEKGGAGKTTLAVHLATAATLAWLSAVILDLDPQGSAYAWAERRAAPPEAILPVALPTWLGKLTEAGAGLVVLDTGRDSNNAGYTAAKAADMILIPCRAGGFDLMGLGRTLDLCRLAGKLPVVILNALRPGSTRAEADARESLTGLECDLCPVALHERADFRAASITARTAQETEPSGKAAEEIGGLYNWFSQQPALSTTPQRKGRRP